MSSSIWTQCAGDSRLCSLQLDAWRVVESQHHVSTRKLVDTLDEQALLEELIDTATTYIGLLEERRALLVDKRDRLDTLIDEVDDKLLALFNVNGEIYAAKLQHNIEKWNRTTLSGYVVCGSTGESVMLTES